MENKEEKRHSIVKQDLSLHLLFHYIRLVRDCDYGYIEQNPKIKNLFDKLYNLLGDEIDKYYSGNIIEQYVITICEEE